MSPFNPKILSDRVNAVDVSGVRKVFDLARSIKDPINLSIGQPHFDVPDTAKAAAAEAIQAGKNAYTQTQGGPEMRAAILAQYPTGRYDEDQLLITSGVTGALTLAFMATLNEGDEVLTSDPYFLMYKQLPKLCGAVPTYFDTYPDFRLNADRIEAAITPKTKILVFSNPANPTGAVASEEDLKAIGELAERHNLLVISDELYRDYTYDQPAASMADVYENTLVLDGLSKSHAMTGWRLGWATGPAPLIQAMTKLQQFTYVCAPSFAQVAAAGEIGKPMQPQINDYRQKRDRIYNGLREIGYEVEKPGGAFYIFPRVPWGTDMEFVEAAIENNLLIIPGSVFSEASSHFRISYAATDETLDRGLEALKAIHQR
ncbi:MAG: pyridoxal phosphate-dependent aminotransferase [Planctomycetota bacterium]|jgi:aspartate aminotransferase/aminotransferase